MSERTTKTMNLNGIEHHADVQGEGPSVVFLHAGIADLRMWDDIFDKFTPSFRAIRYDMRGYGQTGLDTAPFSYTRDLEALLGALDVEYAVLIGCSFGAQIAVDFAIEHPELVAGLVLAAPVVRGWDWSDGVRAFGAREDELLDAGDLDGAVDLNIETWVIGQGREREDVDGALIERVAAMQRRVFEVQMAVPDAEVNFPDWLAVDNLGQVQAEALLISGVHDVGDIHRIVAKLDAEISGAKHISLVDTAHMIPMERPEAFAKHALKFLEGLLR